MFRHQFLKDIKLFLSRYKFLSLSILIIFFLFATLIVFAATLDTPDGGYKVLRNFSKITFHNDEIQSKYPDPIGACIYNNSNVDYFVPTKTLAEWGHFASTILTRPELKLYTKGCCGDGSCAGSEDVFNCPADCGHFSCGNNFTDVRDSQVYPTVLIGTQCWMAKNMNYGSIAGSPYSQNFDGGVSKWCYGEIGASACNIYGGLYTVGEAENYSSNNLNQGICPPGWRVPSSSDFSNLVTYLGGYTAAPGKMVNSGVSTWPNIMASSTDSSGFNALGAGLYYGNPIYEFAFNRLNTYTSSAAAFWESGMGTLPFFITEAGSSLVINSLNLYQDKSAASVRCILDTSSNPILNSTYVLQYAVDSSSPAGGTISGTNPQSVSYGQSGTAVTAVPSSGYSFTKWSDGSMVNPRTDTNVTSNIYVTAIFTACSGSFTDARDSQSYPMVMIGDQCWMAQNLNIGTMVTGHNAQSNNSVYEKYCYNNSSSNCNTYGGLYQWGEAVQYINGASDTTLYSPVPTGNIQGICPLGWHLPMISEMSTLSDYLGAELVAGGKLKQTGTTLWLTPNVGADNSTGFTAVPSGDLTEGAVFGDLSYAARYWGASASVDTGTQSADMFYLMYNSDSMVIDASRTNYDQAYSVRCVRD
jgi:uncharacterized protein (TIGR02145 family)